MEPNITYFNMDTLLKPVCLDLYRNSPICSQTEWKRWHKTFANFLTEWGGKVPSIEYIVKLW